MGNETIINPSLTDPSATMINPEMTDEDTWQESRPYVREGTIVCGRYRIQEQLEVSSGEADLYLCTDGAIRYVAKIYKRQFAVKPEVIEALRKIESPYIARIYDAGSFNGYPVEILPFFEKGSLQGRTFSEEELIRTVIPDINEGLHVLHEAGIIHKDIKPSNIMLNSDGETVSLIDFGISSVMEAGSTILVTRTGMTPEYSAPETFRNVYLRESDYYSFGITLFELFCGYTPYANMQPEEIEQYITVQKIPFPANMSENLKGLITALTYSDISKRNDKDNPNRRWTFEEVKKWLNKEPQGIPGEGTGNPLKGEMPAYVFMGKEYKDLTQLVLAFAKNWEEGKKQLFRGLVTAHFRRWNLDIARKCQAAEEEAGRENGKDDLIFWKLLYQINPKLKGFYWMGQVYEGLPAFGRDMLERLWDKDKSQYDFYSSILSEKLLSHYVMIAAPQNEKMKRAVQAIEDSFELEVNNGTDKQRTYYLMAYTLSGQKILLLDGNQFRTVGELATYMKSLLAESFETFESLCHRLVDYNGNLDFQLETWLIALGKQKEIERWRNSVNE